MKSNNLNRHVTLALIVVLASLVSGVSVFAQSESAALVGTVTTGDGIGLPGVAIALDGPGGAHFKVVSGEEGVWSASGLAAGSWAVHAELTGFAAAAASGIELAPGRTRHVEIKLDPAAFFDTTAVTGEAPDDLLSAGEIRETAARELDDAFTKVAGVHRLRKGGIASDVVLRGYQGANLNLLVDGVKVQGACPGHMDPPAFHADLAEIDRVEIAPGPFDVKNAGSLGGLINLVGKRPAAGFGMTANLAAGSFSYANPSVTVHGGDARFSVLGGLSYRTSKPFATGKGQRFTEITNYRTAELGSDAYRVGTGWARAAFSPTESQTIQAAYTRQEADHVLYPYLQMDAIYDDTDRGSLDWTIEPAVGALHAVRAQAYATRVQHYMTDDLRTSSVGMPRSYSMATMARTSTEGGRIEAEVGSVTFGVEATRREWDASNVMAGMSYKVQAVIPGVRSDAVGAYATARLNLSSSVRLESGLRVDRFSTDADAGKANTNLYWAYAGTRSLSARDTLPSGYARIVTEIGSSFEASAGVGSSVRGPDAQERYYAAQKKGTDWVGNPSLSPTRATGLHLSLGTRATRVAVVLACYWDELRDYVTLYDQRRINMTPGVMNSKARSYANVDAAMRGFELTASTPLGSRLFLAVNTAWVRGTQSARPLAGIRSRDLAEIPPLTSRVALRWDSGRVFLEGEGVFAAAQTRVNSDVQEERTPGYGVANLRAGGHFKGLSLAVALNNVANRQYIEHLSYQRDPYRSGVRVPEPGRSLTVNLGAKY